MAGMNIRAASARTYITGGAGFIGGELIARLLADGGSVTVLDDLSSAAPDWADRFLEADRLTFVRGSAADASIVGSAMAGHDRVVHLAAGTDIAGGYGHPGRDFTSGIVATQVVCEAMLEHGIRELWYASSGVVYGRPARTPTAEDDGPLQPESHYAAAKLAGEAIISGFAHVYGWRAFAFRFGNTIGARSDHGVVHDFVVKLLRDPDRLEILGDGSQAKPYIAVEDLVAGMRQIADRAPTRALTAINLGPQGTLSVRRVAQLVIQALGLSADQVELVFSGSSADAGGWPGDTTLVDLDVSAARALGWQPQVTADAAVSAAAVGVAARYRASGRPLLTAGERRVAPVPVAGGSSG